MNFLFTVQQTLNANGVRNAIVGGHAVALHGAVRGTLDVDLVIPFEREQYIRAAVTMETMGLTPRLPLSADSVFENHQELLETKNLVAWSFSNPDDPLQLVDILVAVDLNKLKTVDVAINDDKSLTIVALDDLIEMKRKAGRPQDLADVEALEKLK